MLTADRDYSSVELSPFIQSLLKQRKKGVDPEDDEQIAKLERISAALAVKRDKAVKARVASGMEDVWKKAEEAYLGIDDANRSEFNQNQWDKPLSPEGPLSRNIGNQEESRSTVFFRLTARYTDMGQAKLAELLIPTDDKPFSFGPTPVQDEDKNLDDHRSIVHNGQELKVDATPEEQAALSGQEPPANPINPLATPQPVLPQPPGSGPAVPLTPAKLAEEAQQRAVDKAKKAEKRVEDWMVESNFAGELTRSFVDASKLGVAVMKGPFPKLQRTMAVKKAEDGQNWEIELVQKTVPGYERKSPWSIYPDPTCGEKIRNGEYVWESDRFTKHKLQQLSEEDGYITSQLLKAIEEGPNKKYADGNNPNQPKDDDRFELWFMTGLMDKDDFVALDQATPEYDRREKINYKKLKTSVFVLATMVNDRCIKCVQQPLESGTINYHNFPWSIREGSWDGIGIPEQGRTPQRMCNGALRAMLDNAGLASGVNVVIDQNVIQPADGIWSIGRNKVWQVRVGGSSPEDVKKAIEYFKIPSIEKELEAIIQLSFTLMEHSVNIPLISQGQSGPTQPETARGLELQDNNANQLLRDIARRYDDSITEPIVRLSYEWLLRDPDVPNDEKGDYQIHAHGSVAIVNRAIQRQIVQGLFAVADNPAYGIDRRKLLKIHLKGNQIEPIDVQYTEDEQTKIDQQPPPKDPKIQVAEIGAQATVAKMKADTDRDKAYVEAETQRSQSESQGRQQELQLKRELAMLDYANTNRISIEELKVQLAETTMKLKTQEKLAAQDHAAEALVPPTEPAGKAPKGQSWEK